jgi:large subunit ribosomal protein L15
MKLNELKHAEGAKHSKKRVGRGIGSGTGKTATRGTKGQNARTSGGVRPGYEGGQTPLFKRLPKRGFTNYTHKEYAIVNLGDICAKFENNDTVNVETLKKCGLVKKEYEGVKVLGSGECDKVLHVSVAKISKSAAEKISKAGGTVEVA